MAQVSSNTLAYQQIYSRLRSFFLKDIQKTFKSNQERLEEYNSILSDLYNNVSLPVTNYDPYVKGEPPRSVKFNKFSQDFSQDIRSAASQTDFLSAKIINAFNMFMSEVENEKKYIERISSKSKILQMYNRSESEDLVYLGDSFDNMDYIDISKIKKGLTPLVKEGALMLPVESVKAWPIKNISIVSGNGFLGNNHQVIDAVSPDGSMQYFYVGLQNQGIANISAISDSNPLTYFEYEALNVDKSIYEEGSVPSSNEFCYIATAAYDESIRSGSLIDWSSFDLQEPLSMTISLDGSRSEMANSIEIAPYFGSMRLVKVGSVKVYGQDGSYEEVITNPIYIGSSLDPLNIEVSKNYYYNKAQIKFTERLVSKVEITLSQTDAQDIAIMHSFWKPNYAEDTTSDSPFVGLDRYSPDLLTGYEEIIVDQRRLLPLVTSPFSIKQSDFDYITSNISLKRSKYTDNFNVISFVNSATSTKYFFSAFGNWPPAQGISPGSVPDTIIFSDEFLYEHPEWPTKRYSLEEDADSDISLLTQFMLDNAEEYVGGVYKILESLLFGNDSTEYAFINASSIVVESKSYEVDPQPQRYSVPLSKETEILSAKRLSIGIRDINISYEKYSSDVEVISKPFNFDSPVETLMLNVDYSLDKDSLRDVNINYYVSADGLSWMQMSPIQLDFSGVPEVLCFNQNVSDSNKLPGVSYFNYPQVPVSVNSLVFKMTVTKSRNKNITPLFYSYQLIAKVSA